jgi:uncharacterized protein with FMN-binding domain
LRRALGALAATIIGVYWLVTFKVTPEALDVPTVSVPSPRTTPVAGRTPQPSAARGAAAPTPAPAAGIAATGGTPFTGVTIDTIWGPVQVQIAVAGGKVVDVEALRLPSDRSRSARISQFSAPILRSEAIQAQSARVDVVSGATYTSRAYAQSLDSALAQAKGK